MNGLIGRASKLVCSGRFLSSTSSFLGLLVLIFLFALVFLTLCGPFSVEGVRWISLGHHEKPLIWFATLWAFRLVLVNVRARRMRQPGEGLARPLDLSGFHGRRWFYVCALVVVASLINWRHFHFSVATAGYPEYLNLVDFRLTDSLLVNLLVNKVSVVLLAMAMYMACRHFIGQASGLVCMTLCLFYPLNNSNVGLFGAENIFVACCLFAVYLSAQLPVKKGATDYLLMGISFLCLVLHPLGYLTIVMILLLAAGGGVFPQGTRNRLLMALGVPIVLSILWYLALGKPIMAGLGHTLKSPSAMQEVGMLTHYRHLIERLSPHALAEAIMIAGLVVCLAPGIWPTAGNPARRRLFIVGCLLFLLALIYSALSADHVHFNNMALALPVWYILSGAGISWLLTCKIFRAEVLDRNISALCAVFIIVILVTRSNHDSAVLAHQDYTLWDFQKQRTLGRIMEDRGANHGYCFFVYRGRGEGCALFGPYHALFPGRYRCRFRIKRQLQVGENDISSAGEVGHLDVAAGRGTLVLATLPLTLEKMTPPNEYRAYAFDFELTSVEEVEFRLWTKGKVELCFDSVRVSKLPARRKGS